MNVGIIIANLGTPASYNKKDVNSYLYDFLSDNRVIDLNPLIWRSLLKFKILPKRVPKVCNLYKSIWTESGSPLMFITLSQVKKLYGKLSELYPNISFTIEAAMSYGSPNIKSVTDKLLDLGLDKIILLPMYPQFSSTTTLPLFDAFQSVIGNRRDVPPYFFIHNYRKNSFYINALIESIKKSINNENPSDYFVNDKILIISYHGIPVRYSKELNDLYYNHCMDTAKELNDLLKIDYRNIKVTFQSRFGKEEWLQPYTDKTLEDLPYYGFKHVHIICPGFSVDCLETLEEIALEGKELFIREGGDSYNFIPSLNDTDIHIEMIANILDPYIKLEC